MTIQKLNEAYEQPDHLWTGGKAIRELHRSTSIPKKHVFFSFFYNNMVYTKTKKKKIHTTVPKQYFVLLGGNKMFNNHKTFTIILN